MWVMDVRLPPQPAVPVVASLAASTTATTTSRPQNTQVQARAERRVAQTATFTSADRNLIYAVTGEDVFLRAIADFSAFAAQILADRRSGRLPTGREITSAYLLATGATLEHMGAPNPFSGALLRRALLYLESRRIGRVDIVL